MSDIDLDYSITPEHIFSIATEVLLRDTRDGLRELRQWFRPQLSPQLPSWVFDFTHCNNLVNENGYASFLSFRILRQSDASVGSFFRVVHCNGTSMNVAGFNFHEILNISGAIDRTRNQNYRWMFHLMTWVRLAVAHFLPLIASRRELGMFTRSFIRTIGSDARVTSRFELSDLRLPHSVHWEDGPVEVLNAIFKEIYEVELAYRYEESGVSEFIAAIMENTHNAMFVVTKSLRIGLVPRGAAIGDHIAILASGNAPFALRSVPVDYAGDEAYRIIGGCYVEGIVIRQTPFCNPC
jgi:hypothetical protein